jgi:hypothetical protein
LHAGYAVNDDGQKYLNMRLTKDLKSRLWKISILLTFGWCINFNKIKMSHKDTNLPAGRKGLQTGYYQLQALCAL